MAVTQYVGARYVPLFADPLDWDNERTYEPLTIVYYQGNSYTSRQYVPTGIDISNDEYWALTGNYNAQIEQYRQEVAAFDGRITSAQEAAEGAQTTADAVTTTVDGITPFDTTPTEGSVKGVTSGGVYDALDGFETSVNEDIESFKSTTNQTITNFKSEIDSNIESIESDIEDINKKFERHLLVFGDSWATNESDWVPMYANQINADYKVFGVTGASFTTRADNLISSQLETALSDPSIEKDAITDIIIIGGVNDYRDDPTVMNSAATAMASFLTDLKSKYPNAIPKHYLNCRIEGYPFSVISAWQAIANTRIVYSSVELLKVFLQNSYAFGTDGLHVNTTRGQETLVATLLNQQNAFSVTNALNNDTSVLSTPNGNVNNFYSYSTPTGIVTRFVITWDSSQSTQQTITVDEAVRTIIYNQYTTQISVFSASPVTVGVNAEGNLLVTPTSGGSISSALYVVTNTLLY